MVILPQNPDGAGETVVNSSGGTPSQGLQLTGIHHAVFQVGKTGILCGGFRRMDHPAAPQMSRLFRQLH